MGSALEAYGLETAVVAQAWPSFAKLLASILSDQPLNNPTADVRAVLFHPISNDAREIRFTMRLTRPFADRDSLEFTAAITESA
jgi:hypothetical protein